MIYAQNLVRRTGYFIVLAEQSMVSSTRLALVISCKNQKS